MYVSKKYIASIFELENRPSKKTTRNRQADEVICTSANPVDFQWTIRRYISKDIPRQEINK
jgi:hypothetical protein